MSHPHQPWSAESEPERIGEAPSPYREAPSPSPYGTPPPYTAPSPYQDLRSTDSNPYGPPAGYQHYQAAPTAAGFGPPATNQLAQVALICSLAGLLTGLGAIAGVICGHIALSQIRRSPGTGGRGLAIAALWVGYALIALFIAAVVFAIVAFVAVGSATY